MKQHKPSDAQFLITLIREIGLAYNLGVKLSPAQKAKVFREIFELLSIMA